MPSATCPEETYQGLVRTLLASIKGLEASETLIVLLKTQPGTQQ